jgi:hypothetical protein
MRGLALIFAMAVAACGCSAPPPLADGAPSAETLATEVLQALTRGDRAALERLAVSEREFRDYIWPELPAARPERNLPFSYVWGDLHQKSDINLGETLRRYGRQSLTLVAVTFGGVTDYAGHRVHREAAFTVRDSAGQVSDVRVCGSMLEKDGEWKVFSYVVDD